MSLTREVRHHDVNRFLTLLEKEGVTAEDLIFLCKYPGFGKRVAVAINRVATLSTVALYGATMRVPVEESKDAVAEIDDVDMLKEICMAEVPWEVFSAALERLPANYAAMVAREHEHIASVKVALKKVDDYILETWKKYYSPGWRLDLVLAEMERRQS